MKDIKSYVIGFLTCACMFLIMGQAKKDTHFDVLTARVIGLSDSRGGFVQISTNSIMIGQEDENGEILKQTAIFPYGIASHRGKNSFELFNLHRPELKMTNQVGENVLSLP